MCVALMIAPRIQTGIKCHIYIEKEISPMCFSNKGMVWFVNINLAQTDTIVTSMVLTLIQIVNHVDK